MQSIPSFEHAFAFYRLPGEKEIQFVQSAGPGFSARLTDVREACFVLAPFDYYHTGKVLAFSMDTRVIFSTDRFHSEVSFTGKFMYDTAAEHLVDTAQLEFETSVGKAVDAISSGAFVKTALSRVKHVPLSCSFDWADWFYKACLAYPEVMVFFVHIPGEVTWAGATPELFLSGDLSTFRSVSLAGTLHNESHHGWREKETTEQGLVTDFIRTAFAEAGFNEVRQIGPDVLDLGSLKHIKTSFEASRFEKSGENLCRLIQKLHPTPAVGGMPREAGLSFLLAEEKHSRGYYSGFLGPWNPDGDFSLFVNLRSMQVFRNWARLFAGAGITDGSVPSEEWAETEKKLNMNEAILEKR
jgi:isochorismate synthase